MYVGDKVYPLTLSTPQLSRWRFFLSTLIHQDHVGNFYLTARYTIVSFIPLVLWQTFQSLVILFYWGIVALQLNANSLSPTDRFSVLVPIGVLTVFVFIKEFVKDYKRHLADARMNFRAVSVLYNGAWMTRHWCDLVEGSVVRMAEGEMVPADCALVCTGAPMGAVYCSTSHLDGETNQKLREMAGTPGAWEAGDDPVALSTLLAGATLTRSAPTSSLGDFSVTLTLRGGGVTVPMSPSNALLRGEVLHNSPWVVGVVCYCGVDCKALHSVHKKALLGHALKRTSLQKSLDNITIALLLLIMGLCLVNVLGYGVSMQMELLGQVHWYLPFLTKFRTSFTTMVNLWGSSIILFNTVLPYSLAFILEISRWINSAHIAALGQHQAAAKEESDQASKKRVSSRHRSRSNSSSSNSKYKPTLPFVVNDPSATDMLGQVDFIVTDKTDTITAYDMDFVGLTVLGGRSAPYYHCKKLPSRKGGTPKPLSPGVAALVSLGAVDTAGLVKAASSGGGGGSEGEEHGSLLSSLTCIALCHEASVAVVAAEGAEAAVAMAAAAPPPEPRRGGGGKTPPPPPPSPPPPPPPPPSVQYFSPYSEEIALLKGLQSLGLYAVKGMEKVERQGEGGGIGVVAGAGAGAGKRVTLTVPHSPSGMEHHTILAVNAFTRERTLMSVVAQDPRGVVSVWVKGAVSSVLGRVRDEDAMDPSTLASHVALLDREESLSSRGLRTMLLAGRVLSTEEVEALVARGKKRGGGTTSPTAAVSPGAELARLESNLNLFGVVALETFLLDGVKDTMSQLSSGGIRWVMASGDSLRTCVSVGMSCGLCHQACDVMELKGESREDIMGNLVDAKENLLERGVWLPGGVNTNLVLAMRASTLEVLLGPEESWVKQVNEGLLSQVFRVAYSAVVSAYASIRGQAVGEEVLAERKSAALAKATLLNFIKQCRATFVCSASPEDKARLVRLLREIKLTGGGDKHRTPVIMAVGDGSNDIPMLEEADIGVGVGVGGGHPPPTHSSPTDTTPSSGSGYFHHPSHAEESLARQCAGISLPAFKDLPALVLWQGRESRERVTKSLLLIIYSNTLMNLVSWAYSSAAVWSAKSLFDSYLISAWNLLFTLGPVLWTATCDTSLSLSWSLRYPHLYEESKVGTTLGVGSLMAWLQCSLRHAALIWGVIKGVGLVGGVNSGGFGGQFADSGIASGTGVQFGLLVVVLGRIALTVNAPTLLFLGSLLFSVGIWLAYVALYSVLLGAYPTADTAEIYFVYHYLYTSGNFWMTSLLLMPVVTLFPDAFVRFLWRDVSPYAREVVQEWSLGYGVALSTPPDTVLVPPLEDMAVGDSSSSSSQAPPERVSVSIEGMDEAQVSVLMDLIKFKSRRSGSHVVKEGARKEGGGGGGWGAGQHFTHSKRGGAFLTKAQTLMDVGNDELVVWKGSKMSENTDMARILRALTNLQHEVQHSVKIMRRALLLTAENAVIDLSPSVMKEAAASVAANAAAVSGIVTHAKGGVATGAAAAAALPTATNSSSSSSSSNGSWNPSESTVLELVDEEAKVRRSALFSNKRRLSDTFRAAFTLFSAPPHFVSGGRGRGATVAPLPYSQFPETLKQREAPPPVVKPLEFLHGTPGGRSLFERGGGGGSGGGGGGGRGTTGTAGHGDAQSPPSNSSKELSAFTMRFFDPQLEAIYGIQFMRKSSHSIRYAIFFVFVFGCAYFFSTFTTLTLAQNGVTGVGLLVCLLLILLSCFQVFRNPLVYSSTTLLTVFLAGIAKTAVTAESLSIIPEVLFQICVPLVLRLPFFQSLALCLVDYVVWGIWVSQVPGGYLTLQTYFIHILFIMYYCTSANRSLQFAMRENFVSQSRLKLLDERSASLLGAMLPRHVTAELRRLGGSVKASDLCFPEPHVTVMFIQIVDFDAFVAKHTAASLVSIMDKLWGLMDSLAERHGVTKLETVGKEFVACCGLAGERPDHASACISMGLDAIHAVSLLAQCEGWEGGEPPFSIRIGVNSGSMVAGIVGRTRPQFCCVGDVMNTAARVAYFGKAMRVNIHENTYKRVGKRFLCVDNFVELKSKGLLNVRWVAGRMGEVEVGEGEEVLAITPTPRNHTPAAAAAAAAASPISTGVKPGVAGSRGGLPPPPAAAAAALPPPPLSTQPITALRHPSLTPQAASTFTRSALTTPLTQEEDESGYEASDALLTSHIKSQQEMRLQGEVRASRQTREVKLNLFTLTFHSPSLESRWNNYIAVQRIPLIRSSLLLLAIFATYRLLIVVGLNWSNSTSSLSRPTFLESIGRAANICLALSFLGTTHLSIYVNAPKSGSGGGGGGGGAGGGRVSWEDRYWGVWGMLLQRYGHVVVMALTGVCFWISSPSHIEGDPDFVFFFTICCNSGILSFPTAVLITLPFFAARQAADPMFWLSNLAALAMGFFSQVFVELYMRHRFGVSELTKDEVRVSAELLNNMLPVAVAKTMMSSTSLTRRITDTFPDVCIMYCDVSGFTKMSAVLKPKQVIDMINRLFVAFEAAAIRNGVFKVQTIGDCFVAVAGMPYVDEPWDKRRVVVEEEEEGLGGGRGGVGDPFSLDEYSNTSSKPAATAATAAATKGRSAFKFLFSPQTSKSSRRSASSSSMESQETLDLAVIEERLQMWDCLSTVASMHLTTAQRNTAAMLRQACEMCIIMEGIPAPPGAPKLAVRIGLHTGSIIGGVIGSKAFRYDIFGLDVLTANTMESSGCPGAVLLSDTAWEAMEGVQASKFPLPGLKFIPRGPVFVDGKGDIDTAFADVPGVVVPDKARAMFGEKGVHEAGFAPTAPGATTSTAAPPAPPPPPPPPPPPLAAQTEEGEKGEVPMQAAINYPHPIKPRRPIQPSSDDQDDDKFLVRTPNPGIAASFPPKARAVPLQRSKVQGPVVADLSEGERESTPPESTPREPTSGEGTGKKSQIEKRIQPRPPAHKHDLI